MATSVNAFPAQISGIIEQVGFLDGIIKEPLENNLAFAAAADRDPIDARRGETITRSRVGILAPNTTKANPQTLGDLDNGLTDQFLVYEQWKVTVDRYHATIPLDLEGDQTLIGGQFILNAEENGRNSATTMDELCAQAFFAAYDAGNTYVVVDGVSTDGAPAAGVTDALHVRVDNILGFDFSFPAYNPTVSPGLPTATNVGQPITSYVYSPAGVKKDTIVVDGVISDAPANTSTAAPFGQSGVLVLHAAPGTAIADGDQIVAFDGSVVVRPNSRRSRNDLVAGDTVSLSHFASVKGKLRGRRVKPMKNGLYACVVDPELLTQLYDDPRFITATQGSFDGSPTFKQGIIAKAVGLEFVEASTIPNYPLANGSGVARHAAVLGEGCIVRSPFKGMANAAAAAKAMDGPVDIRMVGDIKFTTRAAIDKEALYVSQTWSHTGGFACPTDVTSNPNTIRTSDWARNKRGMMIEVFSAT